MKVDWLNEDEAEVVCGGITAGFYMFGDGSAECEIKTTPEGVKAFKIKFLVGRIKHLAKKKHIERLSFLAPAKSLEDTVFSELKGLAYTNSEFMYSLPASEERKDNGIKPVVTNGVEEEEDTFIVRSEEAGLFIAKLRPYNGGLYIYDVKVKESFRNQGIGTKYMQSILYAFKDSNLFLQVGSQNPAACHLYGKLGFKVETEIRYYAV